MKLVVEYWSAKILKQSVASCLIHNMLVVKSHVVHCLGHEVVLGFQQIGAEKGKESQEGTLESKTTNRLKNSHSHTLMLKKIQSHFVVKPQALSQNGRGVNIHTYVR